MGLTPHLIFALPWTKWLENAEAVEIDPMLVSINFDTEDVEESRVIHELE